VRRPLIGCLAVVGGYLLFAWWSGREPAIRRQIDALVDQISPYNATFFEMSGPVQSTWSVTASWQFQTQMDWPRYRQWVRRGIRDFDERAADDGSLSFRRRLPADVMDLRIRQTASGPPTRVKVTFTALAN
jgi:hypothetical protein